MCLARPLVVMEYAGDWAEVDDGNGQKKKVYAALLRSKGLKAGDTSLYTETSPSTRSPRTRP